MIRTLNFWLQYFRFGGKIYCCMACMKRFKLMDERKLENLKTKEIRTPLETCIHEIRGKVFKILPNNI